MRVLGAATAVLALACACGPATRSVATAHPTPPPSATTPPPAPADEAAATEPAASPATAPAPPAEGPPAPTPDTPMCHAYRAVVDAAPKRFAAGDDGAAPAPLPGAEKCDVTTGGKGHSFTATYTCEMAVADDGATLAARRDQIAQAIAECGARHAADSTRVRLVQAAGKVYLVVNVHDTARW